MPGEAVGQFLRGNLVPNSRRRSQSTRAEMISESTSTPSQSNTVSMRAVYQAFAGRQAAHSAPADPSITLPVPSQFGQGLFVSFPLPLHPDKGSPRRRRPGARIVAAAGRTWPASRPRFQLSSRSSRNPPIRLPFNAPWQRGCRGAFRS
jgi:hypothetical protein